MNEWDKFMDMGIFLYPDRKEMKLDILVNSFIYNWEIRHKNKKENFVGNILSTYGFFKKIGYFDCINDLGILVGYRELFGYSSSNVIKTGGQ